MKIQDLKPGVLLRQLIEGDQYLLLSITKINSRQFKALWLCSDKTMESTYDNKAEVCNNTWEIIE